MKIKTALSTVVAVAALMTLSMPITAFSQPKEMEHGPMAEMNHMEHMDHMVNMCIDHADKLGLTEDQIATLKPLHREMQKKHARFKADLKIEEINLQEIMEIKAFDLEKAGASVKKIAELITAHHLDMLKVIKSIRNTLSDEQFKKMQKVMCAIEEGKNHPKKPMKK